MKQQQIIGLDLGATNIRGGLVQDSEITNAHGKPIRSKGTVQEVLEDIYSITDQLVAGQEIAGIGIGVPSVVNIEEGIVYDVQHIPSWKEVPLKRLMEERYRMPVFVNNDANCFALGELYFGKGRGIDHMIGLTLGTGIGAGVIINKKLYAGPNCGAGEFGMVDYLDQNYEYYGSGQFFDHVHHTNGQVVFDRAIGGDPVALQWYEELGTHLGNTIKLVMYCYDPPLIVLGGSVRHAYPFFQQTMWDRIRSFAFPKSIPGLRIELSELQNSGILGAAALYYDANGNG